MKNINDDMVNNYFKDLAKDVSFDKIDTIDTVNKIKNKFCTKLKKCRENNDNWSFDNFYQMIFHKRIPLFEMISRGGSISYGCDKCKCVHNIPFVSEKIMNDE